MMRSANKNHNVLAMEGGKRRLDFQEEYTLKEGRTAEAAESPAPHPQVGARPSWDRTSTTVARL
eukprot:COSAG01_NODE_19896_length_983_cov_1.245475_2_plen_64_part_00